MGQLFMAHPGPLPEQMPQPGALGRLREAGPADASALAALLDEAFEEDWDPARVERELTGAADVARTWVVESDGALVATASERLLPQDYPGAGYLHWVAASSAARGRGLGGTVVRACLAGLAARGLGRCVLETEDHRVAAVRLYLRLGFVPEYRSDEERATWSRLFPSLLG